MAKQVIKELFANDATAKEQLGKVYINHDNGKAYRYVQVVDIAAAKGDSLAYADATTGYVVSIDRSGGSSVGLLAAGVAITAITKDYYGWIQVSGIHSAVRCDGSVAAGDRLVLHASYDGRADTEANGSTVAVTSGQVFGMALAADSTATTTTATAAAMIRCL
jgi:hypothetical protein